jgi:hypothetical protein
MSVPAPTLESVISSLAAFAAAGTRTERDLLCLMILFHTHSITLKASVLSDRPGVQELAALTQRHVAGIAAEIWRSKRRRKRSENDEREDYVYWYFLFNRAGPFEVMEEVPPDLRDTVLALKSRLLEHPDVAAVEIED